MCLDVHTESVDIMDKYYIYYPFGDLVELEFFNNLEGVASTISIC